MSLTSSVPAGQTTPTLVHAFIMCGGVRGCAQLPVRAAGLVTVLYWFCVEMMLDRGLSTGEDSRVNSSTMLLILGWFLGSSLRRCSREYRSRSSFWLDSLKRAWA